MSRIPALIDDLNENIAVIQYLAEVEDKPGLSNILTKTTKELELIRCELESISKEDQGSGWGKL
jgi:glutathione S-transferase